MEKIKLTEPIKIDGILVSELTLRRPKVRDRLAVERMGKVNGNGLRNQCTKGYKKNWQN
ncbi:MAG: phage tail assembly protein [Wolbachia sp.]